MTRVNTAGMSSCATIAISGFKAEDYKLEIAYQEDPDSFVKPEDFKDCSWFYGKVLYPTKQELGKTDEYPFSALMEDLNKGHLKTKLIMVALPSFQVSFENYFWVKLLLSHGFKEVAQTDNAIGHTNVIFMRNPNEPSKKSRISIVEEEVKETVFDSVSE